jgi:putative transposase
MARSKPHAKNLRKGRYSEPGYYYFLTASVAERRKIFTKRGNAEVVLETIRWLRTANRFVVDAAVVMPDHLPIVGCLGDSTLAKVMHTLKSYSAPDWHLQESKRLSGKRDSTTTGFAMMKTIGVG